MARFFTACLTLFCALFFAEKLVSQTDNFCGTPADKSEWLRYFQEHPDEFPARFDDSTIYYTPMNIHNLGNDLGAGYYSPEKMFNALCELNADFAPAKIRFFLPENINYINKTAWYSHPGFNAGGQMMQQNNKPNSLNSYIVADPAGNCGYYWGQFDGLALKKSCIDGGNNTWAHELGHNLSLPHPFYGWEGHNNFKYATPAPTDWDGHAVEKMDGSNCQFAGDGFCDTPPDYLNYRWQCDAATSLSTLTQHDPDSIPFQSDGSLYMSYSLDACANRFSHEQIRAMRSNLFYQRNDLLYTTDPVADLPDDLTVPLVAPAQNEVVQNDSFLLDWEPVADADFYHVVVTFLQFPTVRFINELVQGGGNTELFVTKVLPLNKEFRWSVTAYSKWDFCKGDSIKYGIFKAANLVAINELEQIAAVKVVPNPSSADGQTSLEIEAAEPFSGQLFIFDMTGKQLSSQPVEIFSGENRLVLPTENLPGGVFQVVLKNEKGAISRRLILD